MKDPDLSLADMRIIIDGFLGSTTAIGEDSVQINKLEKQIAKLKKEIKKWKDKSAKLAGINKKILKEIEEYKEYYDRFDILDLGD